MADLASRSFRRTGAKGNYELTDLEFANKFNADYPLTQDATWRIYRHHNRLTRLVFAILRKQPAPLGSWVRPATRSVDIGQPGATTSKPWEWTRISTGPMELAPPRSEQTNLVCSFAQMVRQGGAGRGSQVRSGSVRDALAAVTKGLDVDDYANNPIFRDPKHHRYQIRELLRGYDKEDPKSRPQLAIPVKVVEHIHHQTYNNPKPGWNHNTRNNHQATSDLITVAFYYLLRVGEYTKSPPSSEKQTIPFRVGDITLRDSNNNRLDPSSPLETLLTATEATLKIENQKNGSRGDIIHQESTGLAHCPIKALARRIHNIMSNGGSINTYIYQVHHSPTTTSYISPHQINQALKKAAGDIGLYSPEVGYTSKDISSHSIRSGGAMAMHLSGASSETIKKVGRWKGNTFLMYIQSQISAYSQGLSKRMSQNIPFRQIAGPTLLEQANQAHLR